MNHYPHHIGDYDADTAHLEWIEDMAYTRLLRLYYRTEKPIPLDIKEACRLVRARSGPERKAVEAMLKEFFEQCEDGWHNKRADEELTVYFGKSSKASASAKARWSHTERNANASANAPPDAMRTHSDGNANQNQNQNQTNTARACGAAAMAMKRAGMGQVNPSDPRLQALVDQGVTEAEFESAAREAVEKEKPFGYALAIVEGRRRDAGKITALPTRDRLADFRGAI